MPSLQPYKGTVRKLVLGIDVGTTYSGIAYTILDPGEVPQIHGVTRFPGQEAHAGDSKIPSILYYRQDGTVHCAGAEAAAPGMEFEAEDHDLVYVEWFKLHLRPERLDSDEIKRKDVTDVFADFLRYLFACAETYIRETHASGDSLWSSLQDRIEFVLSHPNGWEGLQQGRMRQAAVKGGLVPATAAGHEKVHFVTEGEASLNFCIQSGLTTESIRSGQNVMIVDAGGGTVDVSSYKFLSAAPISVEEVTSPDCILQGSTRVNVRAEQFLKARLANSAYGNEEDVKTMVEYFNQATKPVFKNEKEPSYIRFGAMSCNDPAVKIKRGQLMLSGSEMAAFFQPSLDAIVRVVQKQRQAVTRSQANMTVFLVGGFAANPWLYGNLKNKLGQLGLNLCRPDSHSNKAVAHGAVCHYLEHFVSARVMKMTYGIQVAVDYKANDPEHYLRRGALFVRPSGRTMIKGGYSSILKKGTRVRENEEISQVYTIEARDPKTLRNIVQDVLCYRGNQSDPYWLDADSDLFTPLCTVSADTSKVSYEVHSGAQGLYYIQEFSIILLCGMTELQAQLSWVQNGMEKRGPAKIVYDDDLEVSQ